MPKRVNEYSAFQALRPRRHHHPRPTSQRAIAGEDRASLGAAVDAINPAVAVAVVVVAVKTSRTMHTTVMSVVRSQCAVNVPVAASTAIAAGAGDGRNIRTHEQKMASYIERIIWDVMYGI